MIKTETVIRNATGLHARPATDFVALAKTFSAAVTIRRVDTERKPVNAKSILMVLAEGCDCGTRLEIAAEGPDAAEAVAQLAALIEAGFGE